MPFPSDLSAPQETTLRTSGWWSRVFCCLNPNDVVFRAQASETIDDQPFLEFTYDNVTIGAYEDVWEGMLLYLSPTTNINDAYYRGRVRLAPTSGVMYVDKNASILTDNDYVIVVRDGDLFTRIRDDALVDGSIAFHETPDVLQGLPSAIVLYDSANAGEVSYTTVQTPVHVDANSTSTTTWLWEISGIGASSISDAAVQNPTLTFEAGYHYLVRCTHTNNLGDSNYQFMQVYAVTRTFGAPVVLPVVVGGVDGSVQDGWTASLTAYADVVALAKRTHCVVWLVQHFGDNSDTPIVDNVLMNGRIRSDTIQTEGSAEAGRLQQVTFTVEGITAYLRRERIPNDIVRSVVSPNEWGEGIEWNPFRMAMYAMWAYTTLTNICSVGVETGAFEAFQIGGEPRSIDGGVIAEVFTSLLWDTIKAAANYAPSGEIYLARDINYLGDRSGVVTVTTLELQDMRDYDVDEDSSKTVSQVVAYGGAYDSDATAFVLYTAQAPSIVYGDGGEERELTKVILTADSDATAAAAELGVRASNEYAAENPKPLLTATLYDSWAGVLIPTNYQRWGATIPASSNTLGRAYGAGDYWLLQAVNLTINTDGTIDVKGDWPAETEFDDAQTLAELLPLNLSNMNPVLPVLPNDPMFPVDSLENYPTDTPGLDELQPIDADSAASAYTPWPPDVAAEVGAAQNKPNCKTLRVLFNDPDNTTSTWTTANTVPYLLTASGTARINLPTCTNLRLSQGDYVPTPDSGYGQHFAGQGLGGTPLPPDFDTAAFSWFHPTYIPGSRPIARIDFFFNQAIANFRIYNYNDTKTFSASVSSISVTEETFPDFFPFNLQIGGFGFTTTDNLVPPDFRVTRICLYAEDEVIEIDTFYQWRRNEAGEEGPMELIEEGSPAAGLFIDNSKYAAIPPPDRSHRYEKLPFTGTGNVFRARMELADYTGVSANYLYLDVCRQVSS